jgi:hypothetical protein
VLVAVLLKLTLSTFDPALAENDGLSRFTGSVSYGVQRWTPVREALQKKKPDFVEVRRRLGDTTGYRSPSRTCWTPSPRSPTRS